jgi:hypothetical protein
MRQLAIVDMQIRPANTAGGNFNTDLSRTRLAIRELDAHQGLAQSVQTHRQHQAVASAAKCRMAVAGAGTLMSAAAASGFPNQHFAFHGPMS